MTSTAVQKQLSDAGFVFDAKTGKYFFKAEPVWTKQERIESGKRQGAFPAETLDEFRVQAEAFVFALKNSKSAAKKPSEPTPAPVAEMEPEAVENEEDDEEEARRKRKEEKKKRKAEEAALAEQEEKKKEKKRKRDAEPEQEEQEDEEEARRKRKEEKKKRKAEEAALAEQGEEEEEPKEKKKKKKSKTEVDE
jgi:hypothetical protein